MNLSMKLFFALKFSFVLGGFGCGYYLHNQIEQEYNVVFYKEFFECPTLGILTSKEMWLLMPTHTAQCKYIQREQKFIMEETTVMKRSSALFPKVSIVEYALIPGQPFRIGAVDCDLVYLPFKFNFTLGYDPNTRLKLKKGIQLLI